MTIKDYDKKRVLKCIFDNDNVNILTSKGLLKNPAQVAAIPPRR